MSQRYSALSAKENSVHAHEEDGFDIEDNEQVHGLLEGRWSRAQSQARVWSLSMSKNRRSRLLWLLAAMTILLFCGVIFFEGVDVQSHRYNFTHSLASSRKGLILASYTKQDVEWLSSVPDDWEIFRYVMDEKPHGPGSLNGTYTPALNQGREAMAYLTFIIDNYDQLPDYMVFVHGHGRAWHQPEPLQWKLQALNIAALEQEGYINLHCGRKPGCENALLGDSERPQNDEVDWAKSVVPAWWIEHQLQPGPVPAQVSEPCCAQFAVSKSRVLARSLDFWKKYRRPLESDVKEMQAIYGKAWNLHSMGTVYEYIWHVVMGQDAVSCPAEDTCRDVFFSGAIECDQYTDYYMNWKGWKAIQCTNSQGWE